MGAPTPCIGCLEAHHLWSHDGQTEDWGALLGSALFFVFEDSSHDVIVAFVLQAHDKTKGNLEATPAMNSTYEDVNAIRSCPYIICPGEFHRSQSIIH